MKKDSKLLIIMVLIVLLLVSLIINISMIIFLKNNSEKEIEVESKDNKKYNCTKTIIKNGLMELKNNNKISINEDGSIDVLVDTYEYYFPVEAKYIEIISNENIHPGYQIIDSYKEDKKVIYSKTEDLIKDKNEVIWYVPYISSLKNNNFVCN